MRKVFLVLMLGLSLGLYACSSDNGGSSQDPSSVDFSAPTGTLSDDNADDVGNGAINGVGGFGVFSLQNGITVPNTVKVTENCYEGFTQGETSGTLDLNCALSGTGCMYDDGEGTYSYDQEGMNFSFGWSDQTYTCTDFTLENYSADYAFNATSGVICVDISYTSSTNDYMRSACWNNEGKILVTVDGDTYFIGTTSGDCADGITMEITDSEGTSTLACDVVEPTTCTSYYQVSAVENCEVQ